MDLGTTSPPQKPPHKPGKRQNLAGTVGVVSAERALALVRTVCAVGGSTSFLDEIDAEYRQAGLPQAIALRRTAPIFDWLLTTLSFQGISDRVARDYIDKHGTATWSSVGTSLGRAPTCPKLNSYWAYNGCRYDKSSFSCSEPDHIDACPLPRFRLRNGRLNQTAYSLFLFVRDIREFLALVATEHVTGPARNRRAVLKT